MVQKETYDYEKLMELYAALPQVLKDAIFSVHVAEKIMQTGKKFGLSVDQTSILAYETGLVMVGALHPRSYIQHIEESVNVDRQKATDIAKEVNHEIFFPVREALKKLHNMEEREEITGEREIEKGDILKKIAELKKQPAQGVNQPIPKPEQKPASPSPQTPSFGVRQTVMPQAHFPSPQNKTLPTAPIQKPPTIDLQRPSASAPKTPLPVTPSSTTKPPDLTRDKPLGAGSQALQDIFSKPPQQGLVTEELRTQNLERKTQIAPIQKEAPALKTFPPPLPPKQSDILPPRPLMRTPDAAKVGGVLDLGKKETDQKPPSALGVEFKPNTPVPPFPSAQPLRPGLGELRTQNLGEKTQIAPIQKPPAFNEKIDQRTPSDEKPLSFIDRLFSSKKSAEPPPKKIEKSPLENLRFIPKPELQKNAPPSPSNGSILKPPPEFFQSLKTNHEPSVAVPEKKPKPLMEKPKDSLLVPPVEPQKPPQKTFDVSPAQKSEAQKIPDWALPKASAEPEATKPQPLVNIKQPEAKTSPQKIVIQKLREGGDGLGPGDDPYKEPIE